MSGFLLLFIALTASAPADQGAADECALLGVYARHEAPGDDNPSDSGSPDLPPGVSSRMAVNAPGPRPVTSLAEKAALAGLLPKYLWIELQAKLAARAPLDCQSETVLPDAMEWVPGEDDMGLAPPLICQDASCRPYRIQMSRVAIDDRRGVALARFAENRNQMHCNPAGYVKFERQYREWRVVRKWTEPCDDV